MLGVVLRVDALRAQKNKESAQVTSCFVCAWVPFFLSSALSLNKVSPVCVAIVNACVQVHSSL